jgi:hypothetical protein
MLSVSLAGHLENFSEDWPRLNQYLRAAIPYVGSRRHVSSQDPLHLRASLETLLRTDSSYMRALCRLLLVDYICFPKYKVPADCADMIPEGSI